MIFIYTPFFLFELVARCGVDYLDSDRDLCTFNTEKENSVTSKPASRLQKNRKQKYIITVLISDRKNRFVFKNQISKIKFQKSIFRNQNILVKC